MFFMNPYIEIMRPLNGLMVIIAVIVGGLLIKGPSVFEFYAIYIAIIVSFLINSAGNAINDYFDVEADKINKKGRPIPSGRMSRNQALYFSIILFLVAIATSGFLPLIALAIALINSFLLIIYNYYFKRRAYIGNIVISYLVGSTYIFGSAAFWEPSQSIRAFFTLPLILFSMSFFVNISREIIKDLEDIEGDKTAFLKRLTKIKHKIAERFGLTKKGVEYKVNKKISIIVSFLCIIIAIIISFLPYVWNFFGLPYLIIVTLSDLVFIYTSVLILKARKQKDYSGISKRIKISMFIGLLAFILGALLR